MGLDEAEVDKRVHEAAEFVGLDEALLERSPFELSGGQSAGWRWLASMAMKPRILVLDEPAAGLDPEGRDDILSEVKEYHKKTGTTVLLVSHSMEDIAKYADKVQRLLEDTDFLQPRSRVNEMVNNFIKPGPEACASAAPASSWGTSRWTFDPGQCGIRLGGRSVQLHHRPGLPQRQVPRLRQVLARRLPHRGQGDRPLPLHHLLPLLMSMEMPLPKKVYGHGWLVIDGGKMSKSKGNVIDRWA